MGCVNGISSTEFPKQGPLLGKRVRVMFHYDSEKIMGGVVVRDDYDKPWVGVVKLDDGRHVLFTECQYQPEE